MIEKLLTSEFIDVELEMLPVPPGTPPSPRPPDRPREDLPKDFTVPPVRKINPQLDENDETK